jgi:diguanylate cyclase (GGDEF)-like protein
VQGRVAAADGENGPDALRRENLRLRLELDALSQEAAKNEKLFRRFHALELSLLHAITLPELVDRIIEETRATLALDAVTLALYDPAHEIRNLLTANGVSLPHSPLVQFVDGDIAAAPASDGPAAPWLGPYLSGHAGLFGRLGPLGSVALLPLIAQGCLVGALNLGSSDPGRYTPGLAIDFHNRLASVTSVCLQNAINRERLIADGHTDPLTGWSNRRYLEARLPQEVALAVRHDEPLSCLVLDVDHFKHVNDRYGHVAGDGVLREFAARVRDQLRTTDLAVRFGGEEFAVFLIRTGEVDARQVAERIRRRVAAAPFRLPDGRLVPITVSGGIAGLLPREHPNDAAALGASMLRRADAALYRAKARGRNRIL